MAPKHSVSDIPQMGDMQNLPQPSEYLWLGQLVLPDFIHLLEIVIADVFHTMGKRARQINGGARNWI